MELGALVCTAKAPRCHSCPIKDRCAWVAQGKPAHAGPPRRVQGFAGTDRQVRGRLLSVVREAEHAVARSEEHTSELQSLMRISYAVFCLKKKKSTQRSTHHTKQQRTTTYNNMITQQ